MYWRAYNREEINKYIHLALSQNIRYSDGYVMGYPASFLDRKIFPKHDIDSSNVFWRALWENPNHIGCHTFGLSESVFEGTHKIERDLLRICAEEIFGAKKRSWDGYVASGGTEVNIQALWVLRNHWTNKRRKNNEFKNSRSRQQIQEPNEEVTIISSSDQHYSIDNGCGHIKY